MQRICGTREGGAPAEIDVFELPSEISCHMCRSRNACSTGIELPKSFNPWTRRDRLSFLSCSCMFGTYAQTMNALSIRGRR
jgi:hypothetical protein